MRMSDYTDRANYDALISLIRERQEQGREPPAKWLEELERIRQTKPTWMTPPTVIVPPPSAAPPPPPPPAAPPRASVPFRPGERIPILVNDEYERVATEVLEVMSRRMSVFQVAGKLVQVQETKSTSLPFFAREKENPRLFPMKPIAARVLASKECRFTQDKPTKDAGVIDSKTIAPPEWLGSALIDRSDLDPIPAISGLMQAPTLRADGQLVWERGYDASTGIYMATDLVVNVPENPTMTDARVAMARLLDLVCDFDFSNSAGRSVWVAGLLSIVARHTFKGPAPAFIIDASMKGSGKSKLADLISVIAMGIKASRMYYTDDDTEMDKRITALALSGEQMVLIDNVVGTLASPPLDAALTSDAYCGRVLGKSEMKASVPMKIVWLVTGNGMIIGADTARRSIFARLEPKTEHPEDRTGPRPGTFWRYPDLIGYALAHRAELLGYALTIVKAYILAGRPDMGLQPMGSFEAWSGTIRGSIVFAGVEDPCVTVRDARAADLQDQALRMMVECWPFDNGEVVTSTMLLERAEIEQPMGLDMSERDKFDKSLNQRTQWRNALLEWLPAKRGELPTARDLGYALRAVKGSIIGDYMIEAGKHSKSGIPWKRVRVSGVEPEKTVVDGSSLSLVK